MFKIITSGYAIARGDFYEEKFNVNFSKGKEFSHCTDTYAGISRYNGHAVHLRWQ